MLLLICMSKISIIQAAGQMMTAGDIGLCFDETVSSSPLPLTTFPSFFILAHTSRAAHLSQAHFNAYTAQD